jgi:hypothetical protein
MSKSKLGTVKFHDVVVELERNPRDVDNYDITGLAADIESNGVQTPIVVSLRQDSTLHALRGHRRLLALAEIEGRNPERFKALDRVPAIIYEGLTFSEEVDLIHDHSNQRELTRKSEMYRTVASLLRNGFSEKAIALKCDSLFARMVSREPEGRLNALKMPDSAERAVALLSCWRTMSCASRASWKSTISSKMACPMGTTSTKCLA